MLGLLLQLPIGAEDGTEELHLDVPRLLEMTQERCGGGDREDEDDALGLNDRAVAISAACGAMARGSWPRQTAPAGSVSRPLASRNVPCRWVELMALQILLGEMGGGAPPNIVARRLWPGMRLELAALQVLPGERGGAELLGGTAGGGAAAAFWGGGRGRYSSDAKSTSNS